MVTRGASCPGGGRGEGGKDRKGAGSPTSCPGYVGLSTRGLDLALRPLSQDGGLGQDAHEAALNPERGPGRVAQGPDFVTGAT